jgi:hypothetical protein
MFALEQLGLAPCYHMRDLLEDLDAGLPLWEGVADGEADWERIFQGAASTVDWPSARYYRELMDHYPEAKVLLSVRPAEDWVRSMRATVWGMYHGETALHHLCEARAALDPLWGRFMSLMRRMSWDPRTGALAGDTYSDAGLAEAMVRWNDEVERAVPAERLLVWDPTEGWGPICEFLDADVPAEPLPRLNDSLAFREGIIGGAVDVVCEWWEARERPSSGLHGAAVSSS